MRYRSLVRRSAAAGVVVCALAAVSRPARAQQRTDSGTPVRAGASADTAQHIDSLSYDDAAAVAYLYDQTAALRATSGVTVAADQTVDGNVAVLEAPLTVAGHVTGHVVVINGNVVLHGGARIDGDLIVTGGAVTGLDSATVRGSIRIYRPAMSYRMEGEHVVAVHDESRSIANWFRRWRRRHARSQSNLTLRGGTYNRVEGLPILFGPTIRRNGALGRFTLEALGIYRSADGFAWKADNLGYTTNAELRFGGRRGIAIGAGAFDVVQAAEPWQLRDSEIGLASFFLHRDYRDYYNRKGARAYASWRTGSSLDVTLAYGQERWQTRATRDPFTLFRNSARWRPNPLMDEGYFHLLTGSAVYDTRNNAENPWTGWLVVANLEHGWSGNVLEAPTSPIARPMASGPVAVRYVRGFVDARRYNRVSPEALLNFRLVLGGWLGGDPLPLERRFSLGGAGTLPGYDFRQVTGGEDVLTCSAGEFVAGRPAQCDRMALAQVEYRHNLHLRLFGGAGSDEGGWSFSFYHPLQWVVFSDVGRGWLLHEAVPGSTPLVGGSDVQRASAFPALDTFKSDVGIGIDAEVFGVFVAKSLTDSGNPVNVVVRLRHRF